MALGNFIIQMTEYRIPSVERVSSFDETCLICHSKLDLESMDPESSSG